MARIAARWCLSVTMASVVCVAACSDVGDNTPFVPGSANDAGSAYDASLQDSATPAVAADSAADVTHRDAIDDGSDAASDRTIDEIGTPSSGSTGGNPSSGMGSGSGVSGSGVSGSSSGVSVSGSSGSGMSGGSSGTSTPDAGTTSTPDAGANTTPDATTRATDGGAHETGTTHTPDTGAPDAGTAVALDTGVEDAAGSVDTDAPDSGSPDSGTGPETGTLDATAREAGAPDAGRPDVSVPDAAPSPCAQYNSGNGCTPTEQKFVDKSVDCYNCLVNAACLDDNLFGDVTKECEDLTGNATGGPKAGTANSALCHATLDCILSTKCASTDVSTCYCGTLLGSACATANGPADGPCAQVEAEGVDHTVADPASVVSPLLADVTRPSGKADAIFACADLNMCGTVCSQ